MRRTRSVAWWAALGVLLAPLAAVAQEEKTFVQQVDDAFGTIVGKIAPVLFWEPGVPLPLIVLVLLFGALFYTVYHGFLNIRGFKHALEITWGKYDNPDDPGEISHFQALTSALSATVGLGNIAGVAVAVWLGGPGAVLWMILLGIFGMSAKLHECTLAQLYRLVDRDGTVHGGPMYYLQEGLKEKGLGALGKVMAVVFAVFCILGSFGGGNMFQANQAFAAAKGQVTFLSGDNASLFFGLFLAVMVGLVIIGGIKKIGQVTEKIIPLMCGIYLVAGVVVIITHFDQVPGAVAVIFGEALNPDALYGGIVGVLVQGIKRAVFSNEAGVGSAAIAHSAAKTDEPAREGMVAMLGPFIDTVVICAMTGIILVVSGAYDVRADIETTAGPYDLEAGQTVVVATRDKHGNDIEQTVTFEAAGFSNIDAATAAEVQKAFDTQLEDVRTTVTKAGTVYVLSEQNKRIEVKDGTALAALGLAASVTTGNGTGVEMTRWAFADTMSWFPWILAISIMLFAYSTMISWSYYGERAWNYLFGRGRASTMVYRFIFLIFVVLGSMASLGNVIDFSDLMILSMAFPNILGGLLLAPTVKEKLTDYWGRYQRNEFKVYK
ncbi:MAG: alanine:cation symporter family protein [Myxococcales bacterium]|nr:alanine:cation symporter family protein [Myxococcales bacterium]